MKNNFYIFKPNKIKELALNVWVLKLFEIDNIAEEYVKYSVSTQN